jgi:hypothetical protein
MGHKGGGGRKIEGEEGAGWQGGASCLALLVGACSWRGAAAIAIGRRRQGGGMVEELADIAGVRQKETRGIEAIPRGEGRMIPCGTRGNSDCGGTRGQ